MGIATVLSFNVSKGWHPLGGVTGFESATVFDLLDYPTSNVLLPIGGLAIAVFAGWAVPERMLSRSSGSPRAVAAFCASSCVMSLAAIAATAFSAIFRQS